MTRRGGIYEVDWSPGRGSEQTGVRPALVIQNDTGNEFSPTTVVAAISSRARRPYPFHVMIEARESGLPQDSIVKCEQIQTIAQSRLGRQVGKLGAEKMREVDRALINSLGIEVPGSDLHS
jgi:mRNA interferase MazF